MDYKRNLSAKRTAKPLNQQNERRRAYKPKPPFRSVEGTESAAYGRLSPYEVWVLMEFYKKFSGFNRFNLCVTYSEVKGKISNGTFNQAIWGLIGYGFLDIKRYGQLGHNASIYGLSERWRTITLHEDRLNKIGRLLRHLEHVKRIRTPGTLAYDLKNEFGLRRRSIAKRIQYALGGGRNMVKNITRSLPSAVINRIHPLHGDAIKPKPTPPGISSSLPNGVGNKQDSSKLPAQRPKNYVCR